MEERIRRGAWPHPPLLLRELVAHLARVIESRQWFPRAWDPSEPGKGVADLIVIERKSPREFVVHVQRADPSGFTVAERGERTFGTAAEAASFYLRWELHLPGDLDGWKVIE